MRMIQQKILGRGIAFTLLEATVSVAIVGILLAASAGTLSAIAKAQRIQMERQQGYMLAQQLMSEILQSYWQDPGGSPVFGPEPGEVRADYNDVDDYNGLTESPPALRGGTVLTEYTGWTRSVVVAYVDPNNPANTISSSTLKRITVTVTSPTGKPYVLVGLRSQYGAYESMPTTQTNFVTGVPISVKVGTTGKTIYTTAHPLNVTTTQ